MYVGTMSTLSVGQARYGILLNENGIVVDDGIVARLGECHYWVNTTSAGVERTTAAFEEWLQCEYTTMQGAGDADNLALGQCDGGGSEGLGAGWPRRASRRNSHRNS
jgi:glycine cleavage system aminomethyltransferase T